MLRAGAGDPVGFKLDDCSTQRNLSGRGRADAVAIGAQIRANGISFTRIISSPWCRCVETAKLMDLGPVDIEPAFSNAFVLRDRREELRRDATAILNTWADGTLMVVTHGATELELMSPEATCFGLRRERMSIAEVLQDYRGLPNQPLAMAQKRRGKRY